MATRRAKAAALVAVCFSVAHGLGTGAASNGNGAADAYQDGWGPSVGDAAAPLAAEDQDGKLRDLASLSGAKGLLLVVSRSAVW